MTKTQIKQMVDRFLGWKLPADFSPDGGVSFKATHSEGTPYEGKHQPIGTNLLNASQAEAMISYMVEAIEPRALGSASLNPVFEEMARAVEKFPTWPTDPLHALGVLHEEVGELSKEVLQLVYEPHKSSLEEVRNEALQAAAMALRFYLSLDSYIYKPGLQHAQ